MYFHRKYYRGQWHPGYWVFDGIEWDLGKSFLLEEPDRRAETLKMAFVWYIQLENHIVSDSWAALAEIEEIRHGIYSNDIAIHP